jgi:pyridoxine 5-phosphate synthase
MCRLSVNINKIATLRNARGGQIPDVIQMAIDCQKFGAQGITIHPRPDERHIRREDVFALRPVVKEEFNIEGFPSPAFIELVKMVKPEQVTLVPDPPDALTSNQGWDCLRHRAFLQEVIAEFRRSGIRVSLFVDASPEMVGAAALCGTDRVELYTEPYAEAFPNDPEGAIRPFVEAAMEAEIVKLGLNAGHDLNLHNLRFFSERIPGLLEVSIGHALISDAIYYGMEKTIQLYLDRLT